MYGAVMIEKFIHIRNVGRFQNCNPRGDTSLAPLSLFYGENARGKTTICSILRSLSTGNTDLINERKTLGLDGNPSIMIRINGVNYVYSNGKWEKLYADILIFDQPFVNENIYAGDYIEHDHKRNLHRVVIGQDGVILANKVDELVEKAKNSTKDFGNKKEILQSIIPYSLSIDQFIKLEEESEIDRKIQDKKEELSKLQLAQQQQTEIRQRPFLKKINFPEFPPDFLTLMSKNIYVLLNDAEQRIKEQIVNHKMGNYGESWLSQGASYIKDEKCPFCGLPAGDSVLIKAYRSHFSNEYRDVKNRVMQMESSISSAIGDSVINSIKISLAENDASIEFWKKFKDINNHIIDIDYLSEVLNALYRESIDMIKLKQNNISESIEINPDFQKSFEAYAALKNIFDEYNIKIDDSNKEIQAIKNSANSAELLDNITRSIQLLETKKIRQSDNAKNAILEYNKFLTIKNTYEKERDSSKIKLNEYCENVLKKYEITINKYLRQFQVGFRIVNTKQLYTGGKPSSEYQIEINNTPVAVGAQNPRPGTPCFKSVLSSGDKSALALAFFLALLDQETNLENKVVVFDDPFTSQDCFRRTCTQQAINRLTAKAKQVIVFSHEANFLALVKNETHGLTAKTLRLGRASNDITIEECNIDYEIASQYRKDYSKLKSFADEPHDNDLLNIARAIRPFLESYYRTRFPGHFSETQWLGDFIKSVRESAEEEGLSAIKADLQELEDINAFSSRYHHETNPGRADNEPISGDELLSFVQRTLHFVGHIYL